jgi:chromosome segregation ATPase
VHEGFTLLDADEPEAGGGDERRGATVTLLPAAAPPEGAITHPSLQGREDRAAIQRATADLADAESALGSARDTVESLTRMLEVLESELVTMTRDRDSTRTNVAAWRRRLRDAERHARVARSRLEVLTRGDGAGR